MSRFRKTGKREVPSLSTASLPDLIFTILFFFMITSNLKDRPAKMKIDLPEATQAEEKVEEGQEMIIYIGKGMTGNNGAHPEKNVLQVDNDWVSVENLPGFIHANYLDKGRKDINVTIQADKSTSMGLINDIKKILHEEGIRKIQYVALP
ncbi:MAG: biopolymer transporter ExbD [Candidatus Azobacteroides sp.]|nr:biopolymer transporter ExbD [Candidatus Azobacteroides sp.]